jgi:hypothetical protein
VAGLDLAVNRPKDERLEWDAIDWRVHESTLVRLRRRIFKATREQDWAAVRSLQKLMLRSWSSTLVSVRQVTQRNTGRRTAGIDGQVALSSLARMEMAVRVHDTICSWDPLPVRRVYTEVRQQCQATAAGHSCDHGSVSLGTGLSRTGTRVGGPVQAPFVWVSTGP